MPPHTDSTISESENFAPTVDNLVSEFFSLDANYSPDEPLGPFPPVSTKPTTPAHHALLTRVIQVYDRLLLRSIHTIHNLQFQPGPGPGPAMAQSQPKTYERLTTYAGFEPYLGNFREFVVKNQQHSIVMTKDGADRYLGLIEDTAWWLKMNGCGVEDVGQDGGESWMECVLRCLECVEEMEKAM